MTYEKPVAEVFILGKEDVLLVSNGIYDTDRDWGELKPLTQPNQ